MLSDIKKRLDREDEGFTLIELMVVVLIIAILLAIAIPTFLGARNNANSRAAQSNLRNALTAEQTFYTNNQYFSADPVAMGSIESGISWTTTTASSTATNQVAMALSQDKNVVLLQASGKDGKCYQIMQSNESSASYTEYQISATSGGCSSLTAPSNNPTAPSSGSASGGTTTGWYQSW